MEGPAKGPKPGVLNTPPERIALARREGLDYADFLQIVLGDEVSRRDHGRLELRLRQAGFVAADQYFREMAQARVDHSTEKDVPWLPRPELLILGDLGTRPRSTKAGTPARRHRRGRQAPWRRRVSQGGQRMWQRASEPTRDVTPNGV